MVLCSQAVACKVCQRSITDSEVILVPVIRTSPSPKDTDWFPGMREGFTSGYQTECRLRTAAQSIMTDEAASATYKELRRLEHPFPVPVKLPKTHCGQICQTQHPQPFAFLDLPAEVRVCIYEYAVLDRYVQRIRCFATPALARTSRQLREESLPVFFAINTFVAEVKSSFLGISKCALHGELAEYISEPDNRYLRLGTLDLSGNVKKLLASYPPSMFRLKNIDFCMLSAGSKQDRKRSDRFAMLSVRDGRDVRITTHIGGGTNPMYSKHVHHIFQHGRTLLERLVADPSYKGLYIIQLKEVAEAFKAEPPATPRPPASIESGSSVELLGQVVKPTRPGFSIQRNDSSDWLPDSPNHKVNVKQQLRSDDDEFDMPHAEAYFS